MPPIAVAQLCIGILLNVALGHKYSQCGQTISSPAATSIHAACSSLGSNFSGCWVVSTVTLRSGYLTETDHVTEGKLFTIPELFALRFARLGGILASEDSWGLDHAMFKLMTPSLAATLSNKEVLPCQVHLFPSQGLQVNNIV